MFGSLRSQPAGRDDVTGVVADECADVAFGVCDRCGGRVVGGGMLTGGSAGCGGGCGCGGSGCGGGRCENCIGGVELAALLLDALLCLIVVRSKRGVAPPLVEYGLAPLDGLATFAVDGIVCLALARGFEKSADWRANAPGFRRGVVQGVGLEVLPYFAGADVLPGSDFSLGCGRLRFCVTLDWSWRPLRGTSKSSSRSETVSALSCTRWRSVVGVVCAGGVVVAAAVFEHILRDALGHLTERSTSPTRGLYGSHGWHSRVNSTSRRFPMLYHVGDGQWEIKSESPTNQAVVRAR